MKKFLVLTLFFSSQLLVSQSLEISTILGGMTYSGDLNRSSKIWKPNKIYPSFGAAFRYNLNDFLAFRISLIHGTISGDDKLAELEMRKARNLHFKSQLQELSIAGELNLFRFNPFTEAHQFTIYVFGGVGLFHFNPKALYQGDWVELQPLGTEGQGLNENQNLYSLWDISIPIGGGLKYAISESWIIGLELGSRLAFTDYLDDVSMTYPDLGLLLEEAGAVAAALSDRRGELLNNSNINSSFSIRGNSSHLDYYFMGGLTIGYRLIGSKTKRQQIRQSKNRCPWN